MNIFKKIGCVLSALVLALVLAGCNNNAAGNSGVKNTATRKTGSTSLSFDILLSEYDAEKGDDINLSFTLSGATNYKQVAIKSSSLGLTDFTPVETMDEGLPATYNFADTYSLTSDISSFDLTVKVLGTVEKGKSTTVKISGINLSKLTGSSGSNSNTNSNTTTNKNNSSSNDYDSSSPAAPTAGNLFTIGTTSKKMAANMGMGWNLGNYLDSTGDYWYNNEYTCPSNGGLKIEGNWRGSGTPKVSQDMIQAVYDAGFKSIRIPVSWHNHMSNTSTYEIDSQWMARVKEIVDWAYELGMCVIINVHHDNLSEKTLPGNCGFAITSNSSLQKKSKAYLKSVWEQIAVEFKNYDHRLVFEVLNEPRCVDTDNEWGFNGGSYSMQPQQAIDLITTYEQVCIDTIRSTGGKNSNRYLMIPAYAANSDLFSKWTLPEDPTDDDRLIISLHAYCPYEFAMYNGTNHTTFTEDDKSSLEWNISNARNKFPSMGVVIGEMSAENKDNLSEREAWFSFYFSTAKSKSIPCFIWDNGVATAETGSGNFKGEHHGYLNVKTCTWYFPSLIKAAKNAAY